MAAVLAAAVLGGSMTGLPASPDPIGPGVPPSVFGFLRSSDGGDDFTPGQLSEIPAVGLTSVVANDGTVHAFYDSVPPDTGPEDTAIWYRRSSNVGKSFGPSVRLDKPSAGAEQNSQSTEADATTVGRKVHVTWEEDRLLTADLVTPEEYEAARDYRLSDGTLFEEGDLIPTGTTIPAGSIDPLAGMVLVVASGLSSQNSDEVYYVRSTDDGRNFSLPYNVSDSADIHNTDPVVAAEGSLVAMAYEAEVPVGDDDELPPDPAPNELVHQDIVLSRSSDGGATWDLRNKNLTTLPGNQKEAGIEVAGSTIHVAYVDGGPDPEADEPVERIGYVRSTNAGTNFTGPVHLPDPDAAGPADDLDYTSGSTPTVYADGNMVHVVACHEDTASSLTDANTLLYWRSINAGVSWTLTTIAVGAAPCNKPVIDGEGSHLKVVWEQDVADEGDIFLLEGKREGLRWDTPRNLSSDHGASGDPILAIDADDENHVYVAWTDSTDILFTLEDSQKLVIADGKKRKFETEDVARFTGAGYRVALDGSDVGMKGFEIDGMATIPGASLALPKFVLSFADRENLSGVGVVEPADLVLFTPTSLGETTAGTFTLYFDGSAVGLTAKDENIDAVEVDDGNLYLSTVGPFALTSMLAGENEDMLVCTGFTATTCATTALAFDGSAFGLTDKREDVDAFSFTGGVDEELEANVPEGRAFFSIALPRHRGTTRHKETSPTCFPACSPRTRGASPTVAAPMHRF